jgi:hypothetical protein
MRPPILSDYDDPDDPEFLFLVFWWYKFSRELLRGMLWWHQEILQSEELKVASDFYSDNSLTIFLAIWYMLHCLYPPRE